jgi:glyoxylase-like metal-dependent hydrolase (beta-lactamase superfamily II)/rhodanese-related sulfurtransferase
MTIKQMYLGCLAQASYLISDEKSKTAAVVDPRRDIDDYLAEAAKLGVTIKHILLTHFHADFVAGHLELQRRTDATIYLGAKADPDYPFTAVKEGDVLEFGEIRLKILETPGHTPESISILVNDKAVLTGDALFIGDVGRPDLMASKGITAAELASQLYDSVHGKLLKLPDDTVLYPGHGAGSMCGKALSEETVSTIGMQKKTNPMCRPMARDEFVRLLGGQAEAPKYFAYDADLNRRNRETLDQTMARVIPLPADRVLEMQKDGAQVVDTREPDEWQKSHWADSFNIPLSGKYATYSGMVLDPKRPIVVIAAEGKVEEAVTRLGRIGFDSVAGYLQERVPAPIVRASAHVSAAELAAWLERPDAPLVLDVRLPGEFQSSRLEGALNIPMHHLAERALELPKDRWIAIICRTGHRSSVAQSILEQAGFENAANVDGGIVAWKELNLAVTA